MKRVLIYFCLLCTFFFCFACTQEDDEDTPPVDQSLLFGEWILTEARGYGSFSATDGADGNINGTFLFTGGDSDATLRFPTGALSGGAFRDGAVKGTMTYEPDNLGLSEDTLLWDGMLPNGAWKLTGNYLYFTDGIYGDFDGLIDELTDDTLILTGRRDNITVIGNPGGALATLDGIYTFTFVK